MTIKSGHLRLIDSLALCGVCFTLIAAFYFQLVWGELPCAFCNLIRVALIIFGGGLQLNLRFGLNPWNYVLSAVGALIGNLISLLFLFVKAPPNSVPTGSAVFGLHMYSWTFLLCTAAIIYCIFMLALCAQNVSRDISEADFTPKRHTMAFDRTLIAVFIVLIGANVVSSFLENGFDTFKAGGQKHYRMLYNGDIMKP